VRRLLCVLVLTAAVTAAPAQAALRPADGRATHRYLLAQLALRHGEARLYRPSLEALQALAGRFERECPDVLAGSPLASPEGDTRGPGEPADGKVAEELTIAVLDATERLQQPLAKRFYAVVRHLRWSSGALTRLVRDLALEAVRQTEIHEPDLCGDLRFWTASGYTRVSAGTERYDHEIEVVTSTTRIETGPGEPVLDSEALVAFRLKRFEAPADRRLAHRAFPPKPKLSDAAARTYLEAIGKIYAVLGRGSG
jgi:hypothetical protein